MVRQTRNGFTRRATGRERLRTSARSCKPIRFSETWTLPSSTAWSRTRVTRKVKRGAVLFRKDDPGSTLYAVCEGAVRISVPSKQGQDAIFNIVSRGEIFGEIALLDGGNRTADAIAIEDSELMLIERREFLPVLRAHPEVAINLIEILCSRLRRTSEQVEDIVFLDLPGRLAKALLALQRRGGGKSERGHPHHPARAQPDDRRVARKREQAAPQLGAPQVAQDRARRRAHRRAGGAFSACRARRRAKSRRTPRRDRARALLDRHLDPHQHPAAPNAPGPSRQSRRNLRPCRRHRDDRSRLSVPAAAPAPNCGGVSIESATTCAELIFTARTQARPRGTDIAASCTTPGRNAICGDRQSPGARSASRPSSVNAASPTRTPSTQPDTKRDHGRDGVQAQERVVTDDFGIWQSFGIGMADTAIASTRLQYVFVQVLEPQPARERAADASAVTAANSAARGRSAKSRKTARRGVSLPSGLRRAAVARPSEPARCADESNREAVGCTE